MVRISNGYADDIGRRIADDKYGSKLREKALPVVQVVSDLVASNRIRECDLPPAVKSLVPMEDHQVINAGSYPPLWYEIPGLNMLSDVSVRIPEEHMPAGVRGVRLSRASLHIMFDHSFTKDAAGKSVALKTEAHIELFRELLLVFGEYCLAAVEASKAIASFGATEYLLQEYPAMRRFLPEKDRVAGKVSLPTELVEFLEENSQ